MGVQHCSHLPGRLLVVGRAEGHPRQHLPAGSRLSPHICHAGKAGTEPSAAECAELDVWQGDVEEVRTVHGHCPYGLHPTRALLVPPSMCQAGYTFTLIEPLVVLRPAVGCFSLPTCACRPGIAIRILLYRSVTIGGRMRSVGSAAGPCPRHPAALLAGNLQLWLWDAQQPVRSTQRALT